ncbi:Rhomboid-like protein 14, mitochondrial [Stylosanthes scabra]|uniref:Rhomboid-like protein 14, mitochondrial n=1 Tax=Stylosanthes scabra TaxID=79078 RepID=A0ABU6Y6Q8_9FABA|nr:Rhomboid-like protein 14, mitochondrial [Stylosanthes scabra]
MEVRIGRRVSRGMIPLLALHTFTEYYRSNSKPPVTAALIAANTLIYLRPSFLHSILPSIDQVWFNPHLILRHKDLKRFLLSPFYHIGEPHLFYNMLSLLWKGIQLETSMGSFEFASMVASLLAMSQGITLMLSKSLLLFFDYEKPYYNEYAVGFSGVLFAMKVVLNSRSDEYTSVYGVIVPSRYAAWAELILIQMFVPGVSFLGHLGGILAGILYMRLRGNYFGSDPLSVLMRGVGSALNWPVRFLRGLLGLRRGRITGRGTVGGGGSRRRRVSGGGGDNGGFWRCQACTYDNSGYLNVCEMCGTTRDGSGLASMQWGRDLDGLPLDELRRRRIDRFTGRR